MRVKATREGLVGQETASGYKIDRIVKFVALPSTKALKLFVRVSNPLNGRSTLAQVLEVGPWSEHDDAYVFSQARPLAESNRKVDRNHNEISGPTNGAGIDLGEAVWMDMGMLDNGEVEWNFV